MPRRRRSGGRRKSANRRKSKKAKKQRKPAKPKSVVYTLGRFCAARCELYHQLEHYPYLTALEILQDLVAIVEPGQACLPLNADNLETMQQLLQSLDGEEQTRVVQEFLEDRQLMNARMKAWKDMLDQSEVYCTNEGAD